MSVCVGVYIHPYVRCADVHPGLKVCVWGVLSQGSTRGVCKATQVCAQHPRALLPRGPWAGPGREAAGGRRWRVPMSWPAGVGSQRGLGYFLEISQHSFQCK